MFKKLKSNLLGNAYVEKVNIEPQIEEEEEEDEIGVMIQFLPHIIYVYISRDGVIRPDREPLATSYFKGTERAIQVEGNTIIIDTTEKDLEKDLKQFQLNNGLLEVVRIEVDNG